MLCLHRASVTGLTIQPSAKLAEVREKLHDESISILFVVEEDLFLVGVITKGDVLKRQPGSEVLAKDICNTQPIKLMASLDDADIVKFLTDRITSIPLVDDGGKLVALAEIKNKKTNLNIGAGATSFEGFINLDVESEWYEHHHHMSNVKFVEYNIITDDIPFNDGEVDNIYISHVIEHLKDKDVQKLFKESQRVLKKGGVLRISCPDAEFLAEMSSFDNDFWFWRREWFLKHLPELPLGELTQFDFLVREIATEKAGLVRGDDYPEDCLAPENREKTLKSLTEDLRFDIDKIGNHINYWSYEKVKKVGLDADFAYVLRSKFQGCVSSDMKGREFDKGRPEMSLYVDLVK